MPKNKKLITLYMPFFFNGEHPIRQYISALEDHIFWGFDEVEGDSVGKYLSYKMGIKDDHPFAEEAIANEYWKFIKETYPTIDEGYYDNDCISDIVGIQFYDITPKKKIAQHLFNIADEILSSSSGDDSYFDYDPGLAYCCLGFIEQLGQKTIANKLQKILDNRDE